MRTRTVIIIASIPVLILIGVGITVFSRVTKNLKKLDEKTYAPASCPLHEYRLQPQDLYQTLGFYLAYELSDDPPSGSGYFKGAGLEQQKKAYIMSPEKPVDLYRRGMLGQEAGTNVGSYILSYIWSFPSVEAAKKEYELEAKRFDKARLLYLDIYDWSGRLSGLTAEHQYFHYLPIEARSEQAWTVIGYTSNIMFTFYFKLPTDKTKDDLDAIFTVWEKRLANVKTASAGKMLCDLSGRIPTTSKTNVNTFTSTTGNLNTTAVVDLTDDDGDGLTATEEKEFGTSDVLADTDSDTIPDNDEIFLYFSNPLMADTDVDGRTDIAEIEAGYDPNSAHKLPYTKPITAAAPDTMTITNITTQYSQPNMIINWETSQALDGVVSARRDVRFTALKPGVKPDFHTSYWFSDQGQTKHRFIFSLPLGRTRYIVLRSCTEAGECVSSPLQILVGK